MNTGPLRDNQLTLTRYLREPEHRSPPPNVESRRLKVYQELIYNNIEGFISSAFPVLRKLYQDEDWHALVRLFIRDHRCRTPYFLEISQEFLRFLMETFEPRDCDPPFMTELAHYEWLELALDVSEEEIPERGIDPEGDLMQGVPVISPLVMAAAYQYPVHRIGAAYQPHEPPEQPTYLLVYRNRQDKVCFMESNAATVQLLEMLRDNRRENGEQVLRGLAEPLGMEQDAVLGFGGELLENLRQQSIIAGVRVPD